MWWNLTHKIDEWSVRCAYHEIFICARAGLFACVLVLASLYPPAVFGQTREAWPVFWRPFDATKLPNTEKYRVLTFAVDVSHPPYSYKDASGRLTGFSVELARLICQNIGLTCRFEAVNWDEIPTQLSDGRAEIAIASLRIDQTARTRLAFTHRYFLNPARFIAIKTDGLDDSSPSALSGKDIGVLKGTAHEAFLQENYKSSDIKSYETREQALEDLKSDDLDLFFADGVSLSFWMQSGRSAGCCAFVPGAYLEESYFGEGIAFAVSKKNAPLARIINFGLERMRKNGILDRLYRVHFPLFLY